MPKAIKPQTARDVVGEKGKHLDESTVKTVFFNQMLFQLVFVHHLVTLHHLFNREKKRETQPKGGFHRYEETKQVANDNGRFFSGKFFRWIPGTSTKQQGT